MKLTAFLFSLSLLSLTAQAGSTVIAIAGRPDPTASSVRAIWSGEIDVLKKASYEMDSTTLQFSSMQKSGLVSAWNIPFFSRQGSGTKVELVSAIDAAPNHGRVVFVAARGAPGDNESICASMKSHPEAVFILPTGSSGTHSLLPEKEPSCFSPNILVVAAAYGRSVAAFSSYGPGVRIAAQGVNLELEGTGGRILRVSGTTYPAAMVAGRLAVFAENSPARGAALISSFLEQETEIAQELDGKVEGNRLLRGE